MPRPRDIAAIDTLIGFRDVEHHKPMASIRTDWDKHPAEYMFKTVPDELGESADRFAAIEETIGQMDRFNVRVGAVSSNDDRLVEAMRRHPGRFIGVMPVNPHLGMDSVRAIQQAYDEKRISAISMFPSGVHPPCAINDKHWYPVYAKCCELGIPAFTTAGVPGPRLPMMPQYVGHLDEVCYDFPELKIVMRHGAEPWVDLAVKLLLKWPNLYYSTSAFAPKYWPKEIIDFANTRGSDKVIYAGYYPMGLELERIFTEMDRVPFKDHVWPKFLWDNAAKVLGIAPPQ